MVNVPEARKQQRLAGKLTGEGSLLAAQIELFGAAANAAADAPRKDEITSICFNYIDN